MAVVETLLAHGADAQIRDREGQTALSVARQQGYTAIVQLLQDRTQSRR